MLAPTVKGYLCFALAWLVAVASARADVRFENLTIQEGYPGAWPINITQDKQGFLWIADFDDGLIRYDGYEFKSYRHNRSDPDSITSNAFSVNVDAEGTLWVGTDAGLNRYDAKSDRFTAITTQTADPTGLSHNDITFSLVDSAGRLWIGTQAGLNRLDPGSKRFRQYHVRNGYPGARQDPDFFWTGFEDSHGRLWFGSKVNGGLHLYDPQSDTLRQFLYNNSSDSPPTVGVRSIIQDRLGFIWVAGSTLARLDPDTMRFERFYLRSDTEHVNPLKLPEYIGTIYSLAEDSAGNLWIATNDAGVIRIAPDRRSWTMYTHDPNDRYSIATNEVYASFIDRSGQVWFGGKAGLSRYNPLADTVDYVKLPAGWPATETLEALLPRADGRIVVTVTGKGIWLVDVRTGSWSRLPWPRRSSDVSANAIWTAPDSAVWVSLPSKPYLFRLDPSLSRIEEFDMPEMPGSYWGDRQGQHWFGLNGVGLARLDSATKTVTVWNADPLSSGSPGHGFIYDIFEDSRSGLWLAHEGGVDLMDRTNGQFSHYVPNPANPQALISGNVRRIFEDDDNNLWIHTSANGMTRLDRDTGRFINYPLSESPIDTMWRGGDMPLSDGKLWWSTARGLAAFDLKTRKYRLYGIEQGITQSASDLVAMPDGRIALSLVDRIGLFDPARLLANATAPTPVITRLKLGSHEILGSEGDSTFQIDGPPSFAKVLTVAHDHPPLAFEFSALHYSSPSANRYAYRLEGLDPDWVETDASNRRATYTTLPPGRYTFRIKAANADGLWSDSTSPLMLTVLPPWWQTWWAYLAYATVAVLLLVLTSQYRSRSLRARATDLEQQVASRTRELVEQREHVQSQAHQLEVLAETKDRLMTRISHEFRTPLTVILGPIDRLQGAATGEPLRTYLATAKRNASRLLRLVDQMLSLARLKSGRAEPTGPVRAAPVVRQAIASFDSLAVDRELELAPDAIEDLTLQTTADALEKIAVNLISNAIKFSRPGGHIRVSLTRGPGDAGTLAVSDTGRGIAASELPHIFEPFKRGNDDAERIPGSGLGLALVHELVTAHGGQVEVESTSEVGSTFRVSLPLATMSATQSVATSVASEDARLTVAAMTVGNSAMTRINSESPRDASLLVIEDNPDMRDYLGQVLGHAYQLAFAGDGDSGLVAAFREVPDLVVCDIMLPGKDGYEICHALKTDDRTSHIPVILLTALEGREDRLKGLAEKADDYLVKPFDESELLQRIANLLALRTLLQRRFARDLRFEAPLADLSKRDQTFLQKLARVAAERHADAEFDVSRLASAMAAGERNLQRKLKALLGMSPTEYLREYRLQQAMERLRTGERPGDVAFATGFASQAHFSKCFRAQFGVSPSEVRDSPRSS